MKPKSHNTSKLATSRIPYLVSRFDVRELMLTIEYLRQACEHADGKTKRDEQRLSVAMSVGSLISRRYAHLVAGYQKKEWWEEVGDMPFAAGMHAESR